MVLGAVRQQLRAMRGAKIAFPLTIGAGLGAFLVGFAAIVAVLNALRLRQSNRVYCSHCRGRQPCHSEFSSSQHDCTSLRNRRTDLANHPRESRDKTMLGNFRAGADPRRPRSHWNMPGVPCFKRDRGINCSPMNRSGSVNPTTQHELYLKLFITNGGGW
jgi:hypothetical protein